MRDEGRKAPVTRKAGAGYADPAYDLAVEWLDTKARLDAAQAAWGALHSAWNRTSGFSFQPLLTNSSASQSSSSGCEGC